MSSALAGFVGGMLGAVAVDTLRRMYIRRRARAAAAKLRQGLASGPR